MHKLYVNQINHEFFALTKIAADLTGVPVQVVIVNEELAADAAFKAKKAHGSFPFLETPEGTIVFESMAIAAYFARFAGSDIIGGSAFEQAQVNQWLSIASCDIFPNVFKIYMTGYGLKFDQAAFNEGAKNLKEKAKLINAHLGGERSWLVGDRFTLADLVVFISLIHPFRLVLDAGFRKAMPHVSAWFAKMSTLPAVARTLGYVKVCEKALKPVDPATAVPVPVSEKKAEAPKPAAPKKDDDEFDPFADDDEDEEAAAAALKKKAEEAKAKKVKAAPIAKSIIVWEVKPNSAETDLDKLAKLILAISMDGLVWKTEYKKEPVAFGVFKIAIGAVVEDVKVSTDTVAELIEAIEDPDWAPTGAEDEDEDDKFLVQSVDIQSFNKL